MESEDFPNFDLNLGESFFSEKEDEELVLEVEKLEQETEKSTRFRRYEESDLNQLVVNADAKGTKRNTKWVIKLLEGKYDEGLRFFIFLTKYTIKKKCVKDQE